MAVNKADNPTTNSLPPGVGPVEVLPVHTAAIPANEKGSSAQFPIAYKLATVITLLIAGGMLLFGIVMINNQVSLLKNQTDDFGNTFVNQMGEAGKELILSNDLLALQSLVTNVTTQNNIMGVAFYDKDAAMLASSGIVPQHSENRSLQEEILVRVDETFAVEWRWNEYNMGPLSAISYVSPIQFKDIIAGYALVTFSRAAMDLSIRSSVKTIVAATVVMVLLAVILAFYIGKRLAKPIYSLVDASKAINNGNFSLRIAERRNDEIGYLIDAYNSMAEGLLQKTLVEKAFSRYMSPSVAKQVLSNLGNVELGGKHVTASVLFADIVGFTRMSENLLPQEISELLNEYFFYITQASKYYQGTIDKYMGDCAMIVFGAPEEDPDHCFHSVACAVMIQRVISVLNHIRGKQGKCPIQFRFGINTGEMLAGNMGSHERMQYTVLGDAVNLASRLSTFSDADHIIISETVYKQLIADKRIIAQKFQSIQLKGISDVVDTYQVTDIAPRYRRIMDNHIAEIFANKAIA